VGNPDNVTGDCKSSAVSGVTYECIPQDYVMTDRVNIAGVPCGVWSDNSTAPTHQQTATLLGYNGQQVLVQIISRDENNNVVEFVQIGTKSFFLLCPWLHFFI